MLRHMVFMKYSDAVSQAARDSLMHDLEQLRWKIEGIEDFCTGRNVSPEAPFVHGLVDAFWIDFRDAEARDAYLANETHKAIGARIMASLDGGAKAIFVCDVEL